MEWDEGAEMAMVVIKVWWQSLLRRIFAFGGKRNKQIFTE